MCIRDRDEPAPYYLLSHQGDWLIGWDELNGYFSDQQTLPLRDLPADAPEGMNQIETVHYELRVEKDLTAIRYTPSEIRVKTLDDNLAMAIWYVKFEYKPRFGAAKGESFKANGIFRNTQDGWKFVHYAEAPMSAIMYIERLYRSEASPEFVEMTEKDAAKRMMP